MSEERGRPPGLLMGMSGASTAHSASFTSLGYTGNATPGLPSEICVRDMFRIRYLPAASASFSPSQTVNENTLVVVWAVSLARGIRFQRPDVPACCNDGLCE